MDAVEEIKSRLAIEDVVGEYVQLKRAGRNWKGLSPFTSERSPSFVVSPEKQIWHDFSSGKGGDIFSFVMEMEGLDFRQTMELLARKAGVDLEQFRGARGGSNAKLKERIYQVLELATKFYQVQFSRSQLSLEYVFSQRKFTKDTALLWQLGYAPNTGTALVDFLKSKKFNEADIKAAGLSARAYRGRVQDMFRGRLMIPLADAQGRVIGFTARLLNDDKSAPKYINTPQTLLYDKSRHVFGLHLAKEAIRKSKYAVIAEGNLDVIMSHQVGVRQVVATAGTALTESHLKALSRLTPDIRLSFDADKAGISATERAIPVASKVGVSLSIITIPSGKDPDELIKQDAGLWQDVIEKPKYALDWLIMRYEQSLDLSSAVGKRQFSDVLLPIVRSLSDSVEQDHYLNTIAGLAGVSKEALITKMNQKAGEQVKQLKTRKTEIPRLDKETIEYNKAQDHFMCLMLIHPTLRGYMDQMSEGMFARESARDLYAFLKEHQEFSGKSAELRGVVQNLADYVKILVLQYEELYRDLDQLELTYEATRLRNRLVEQFVKHEKQKLVAGLGHADEAATAQLLARAKQLDALLKEAKGG